MQFLRHEKSTAERYGVAIGAVAVAFFIRYMLYGTLENRIPFAFFTLATLIASWYGGLGPGMLAALSGLLLADIFFLPPHSAEGGLGQTERTGIGIYALTNTFVVVLFWNLHTRLRDAEEQARRLRSAGASGGDDGTRPEPDAPRQVRPL